MWNFSVPEVMGGEYDLSDDPLGTAEAVLLINFVKYLLVLIE